MADLLHPDEPTAPIVYATVGDSCAKIFDTADPHQQVRRRGLGCARVFDIRLCSSSSDGARHR